MLTRWAFVAIPNAFSQSLLFALLVSLARNTSPATVGSFSLVVTTVALTGVLALMGTRVPVSRELAATGALPVSSRALLLVKGSVAAGAAAIALGVALIETTGSIELALAAALAVLGYASTDFLDSLVLGLNRIHTYCVATIVSTILPLLAVLIIGASVSLRSALWIYAASYVVRLAVYLLAGAPWGVRTSTQCGSTRMWLRRESLPFFLQGAITVAATQLPILIVRWSSGLENLGRFETANKVAVGIAMFAGSISVASLPHLARFYAKERERFARELERHMHSGIVLFASVAVAVTLLARPLMEGIFGARYISSASILVPITWFACWTGVFNVIGTALASARQQRILTWLSATYACTVLFCTAVGSLFGVTGAAWGLFASSFVNMGYHWRWFVRCIPGTHLGGSVLWFALIAAILAPLGSLRPAHFSVMVSALALAAFAVSPSLHALAAGTGRLELDPLV